MMISRKYFTYLTLLLIISISHRITNQQQWSNDMTYCIKNSSENNLKIFWHESTSKCPKDPNKIIDLYTRVLTNMNDDKCSQILGYYLSKTIVETTSLIFEENLISQSMKNNAEIEHLYDKISKVDKRILQATWERVIDSRYVFLNRAELADILFTHASFEGNVAALIYLYWKHEARRDYDTILPAKIAYYLKHIMQTDYFAQFDYELKKRINKTYQQFPEQLRILMESPVLRLLNIGHWEYLYAPRDNGPDSDRRTPLTWTKEKNTTDSDGNLLTDFRDNGDIAFGSYYGPTLRFLYVDDKHKRPLFWIGSETETNRWWQAEWHDEYITLMNKQTSELLCATLSYDENRRYVTLHQRNKNLLNVECHWIITRISI